MSESTKLTPEYEAAVTALADHKENRRFLNDSCAHAKLLANLMVGRAKAGDETLIYSGELGKDCFKDALISSKGRVRVVLDSKDGKALIDSLPVAVKDRVELRLATTKGEHHFFVSNNSFRYETDDNDSTAVANFNEPETVAKLKALFELMWGTAIAI